MLIMWSAHCGLTVGFLLLRYTEGVDRGGGGTGVKGAESGV